MICTIQHHHCWHQTCWTDIKCFFPLAQVETRQQIASVALTPSLLIAGSLKMDRFLPAQSIWFCNISCVFLTHGPCPMTMSTSPGWFSFLVRIYQGYTKDIPGNTKDMYTNDIPRIYQSPWLPLLCPLISYLPPSIYTSIYSSLFF